MTLLMKDELMDAQALRALGYAPYGGADIGECVATTSRVSKVDLEDWYAEWMATADRLRASADSSLAAGDVVGARSGYFRASNYFRTAGLFSLQSATLDRLRAMHLAERESFRAGAALLSLPPERIEIPYEGTTLPGYFFRASEDGAPRRTLIVTNGYDGSAEELYFLNGAAALERGYNVLVFDGPGQGSMIIDRGIPFRPDWENVITPVVDFALTLPTVDPSKLVLLGLSFGGYLAPRAATRERRLAACVSDCGPYDLYEASASRLPGFLVGALHSDSGLRRTLLDQLLRFVLSKPTLGWALRRNLLVHGVATAVDFFRLAPEYSLKGIEHLIECPTLVCSAEGDDLSERAPALFEALTCEKSYVRFASSDGAGSHCEGSARTLFHSTIFGWLEGILGAHVER